jgi:hypothetical protein
MTCAPLMFWSLGLQVAAAVVIALSEFGVFFTA